MWASEASHNIHSLDTPRKEDSPDSREELHREDNLEEPRREDRPVPAQDTPADNTQPADKLAGEYSAEAEQRANPTSSVSHIREMPVVDLFAHGHPRGPELAVPLAHPRSDPSMDLNNFHSRFLLSFRILLCIFIPLSFIYEAE